MNIQSFGHTVPCRKKCNAHTTMNGITTEKQRKRLNYFNFIACLVFSVVFENTSNKMNKMIVLMKMEDFQTVTNKQPDFSWLKHSFDANISFHPFLKKKKINIRSEPLGFSSHFVTTTQTIWRQKAYNQWVQSNTIT